MPSARRTPSVVSAPTASSPVPASAAADWLARYLQHVQVEKRLAARTQALYAQQLQGLQQRCAEADLALTEVQTADVRRWATQLRARGQSPRSLALLLSVWRGFYTWLQRQGALAQNPLQSLRAPKAERALPKALTLHAAQQLAQHLLAAPSAGAGSAPPPDPQPMALRGWQAAQTQCMVELLYGSGLRITELLALDFQPSASASGWVDARAAEVHVLGKGGKRRSVPVGAPALRALAQWLAARQQRWGAHPEPALFLGARGARLTPQVARRQLQALALSAGLPQRVHPHMLRHSFASHVLQSSADLRAVQELLGHASIASTQVYTRLDFQHLARTYEAAHPRARKRTPPGSSQG